MNSTNLWTLAVPWWHRSLSSLPSPTLLCISTLQQTSHNHLIQKRRGRKKPDTVNLWAAVITLSALRRMELLLHPLTSLWCSQTVELTHRSTDSFSYMSHFCYIICEQNISVCAVQFYADDAALYVPLINRRSMRLSVSVAGCKMLNVSKTHFTADKNPNMC